MPEWLQNVGSVRKELVPMHKNVRKAYGEVELTILTFLTSALQSHRAVSFKF
jgi:hypothetical protein